jgi:hypothetical protein
VCRDVCNNGCVTTDDCRVCRHVCNTRSNAARQKSPPRWSRTTVPLGTDGFEGRPPDRRGSWWQWVNAGRHGVAGSSKYAHTYQIHNVRAIGVATAAGARAPAAAAPYTPPRWSRTTVPLGTDGFEGRPPDRRGSWWHSGGLYRSHTQSPMLATRVHRSPWQATSVAERCIRAIRAAAERRGGLWGPGHSARRPQAAARGPQARARFLPRRLRLMV